MSLKVYAFVLLVCSVILLVVKNEKTFRALQSSFNQGTISWITSYDRDGNDINVTKLHGQDTEPPFPRWGNADGVDIQTVLAFFHYVSQPNGTLESNMDLLHEELDFPMPITAYVFGGKGGRPAKSDDESPKVWFEERRRRKQVKWLFNERYRPVQFLFAVSLRYLESRREETRWHRLWKAIATDAGIPILVKLDNNQKCSQGNLPPSKIGNWTVPNDPGWTNRTHDLPMWRLSVPYRSTVCNHSFAVPTYTFIKSIYDMRGNVTAYLAKNHETYPWETKIRKAVWRGSMNSFGRRDMMNIVNRANRTDLFDVSIKSVVSQRGNLMIQMKTPFRPEIVKHDSGMPFEDFQKYVAIIDADGNAWSERFPRLLCFNSVVLKVEPEYVDFVFPQLRPWYHYIPVKIDSSDLLNTTQWVMDPANDAKVQEIVSNANQWCQDAMRMNVTIEYFLTAMDFYVGQLDLHDRDWQAKWAAMQESLPFMNHIWTAIR